MRFDQPVYFSGRNWPLYINTNKGVAVPLSTLADVKETRPESPVKFNTRYGGRGFHVRVQE